MTERDPIKCERVSLRELIEKELQHLKEQTELNFRLIATERERANQQLDQIKDLKLIEASVAQFRDFMAEHRGKASMTAVYMSWLLSALALVASLITLASNWIR